LQSDGVSPSRFQVSELLGSFADNELSPECLDGAQKFLASDGASGNFDIIPF